MIPFPPEIERLVDSLYPATRQAQAQALASITRPLYFVSVFYQLAFIVAFYYSGAAAALRCKIARLMRLPWAVAAVFVLVVVLALSVATLPFAWYEGYALTHRFGLSYESATLWFRDWTVATILSAIVSAFVGAIFVGGVRRFGHSWPIAAVIVAAPLILFGNAIFPVYVAPLFNTYTPLPNSQLTRSILTLAASQHIDASVVYEYDMSRQTTEGNAFVAGIGKTERIAIGDNLLHDLKPNELLFVVAHEMGHYKLGHMWLGSLYAWIGTIFAIAYLYIAGNALVRRKPNLSSGLDDPAALALVAALLLAGNVVALPVVNAVSRSIERAADGFAETHTHLGDAGVRAFARLASQSLAPLHPPRLVVLYFYTHPPSDERIIGAARAAGLLHAAAP